MTIAVARGKSKDAKSTELPPIPREGFAQLLTAPKKGTLVTAKEMVSDELYANVKPHSIGSPYKMFRLLSKEKSGDVKVTMYADNLKEWLNLTVKSNFELTTDERYLSEMKKPVEKSKEERRARAAHLPKFQKTKPDPEKTPASGKKVFKGKLGSKSVLFDAGDGSTVVMLESGTNLKEAAKVAKRELVSQDDATPYAVWVFTQQWKASRQAVKA